MTNNTCPSCVETIADTLKAFDAMWTDGTPPRAEVSQTARDAAANVVMSYRDRKNGDWQARIRKGECDDGVMVQAIHAAEQRGRNRGLEEAAVIAEGRAEVRFSEYGITEPDTNDSYYDGRAAELYESLDEEDTEIAATIRNAKDVL